MTPTFTRRQFTSTLAAGAFSGLLAACTPAARIRTQVQSPGYGALADDPEGLLDLPRGFSYRVISRAGNRMADGLLVPDNADGMGCFALDAHRVALVRNHELGGKHLQRGPLPGLPAPELAAYDRDTDGAPLPGGTTTLVYNLASGQLESEYLSLLGTIRNCAGGTTPWQSWLTCEEDVTRAGEGVGRDHGWVFEVPAARRGLAASLPLTAMGRFNHEVAAVDPRTGIVYLTEDRGDSLFYRFLPNVVGELARGGRLQALALVEPGLLDSRNWQTNEFPQGAWKAARWIDLDEPESPYDDLRLRGHARAALLFARGEGIHFGNDELYFCCTSGGAAQLGQVMRYRPSRFEGQPGERDEPGMLQNFVESTDPSRLNYGDNLTVAPSGHLIVCEDQYTQVVDNHLRGITPAGDVYDFARIRVQTEPAGACFSPDGSTLFVNLYHPGKTLAITGPWGASGG